MNKLLAICLLVFCTPHTQVLNIKQAEKVLSVSALIRAKQYRRGDNGVIKHDMVGCSGTFVASDKVLTAAHCFENPTTAVWVRPYGVGLGFKALLIKADLSHDLALLQVVGYQTKALTKLAKYVRIGEKVVNCGSPYFFEFLLSEGIVSQTGRTVKEFKSHYTVTDAMINPGSSGGGAFNKDGELIGVNTMSVDGLLGWAGLSMAVSLEDIKEFLK